MGNKRKASLIIIVVILAALTVFSCVPFFFINNSKTDVSAADNTKKDYISYFAETINEGKSIQMDLNDDATYAMIFAGQNGGGDKGGMGATCLAFMHNNNGKWENGSYLNWIIGSGGGSGKNPGGGRTNVWSNFALPTRYTGGANAAIAAGGGGGYIKVGSTSITTSNINAVFKNGSVDDSGYSGGSASQYESGDRGDTDEKKIDGASYGGWWWALQKRDGNQASGGGAGYKNGGGGGQGASNSGWITDAEDDALLTSFPGGGGSCSPNAYPIYANDSKLGTQSSGTGYIKMYRIDPSKSAKTIPTADNPNGTGTATIIPGKTGPYTMATLDIDLSDYIAMTWVYSEDDGKTWVTDHKKIKNDTPGTSKKVICRYVIHATDAKYMSEGSDKKMYPAYKMKYDNAASAAADSNYTIRETTLNLICKGTSGVSVAPTAKTLNFNGKEQVLINAGTPDKNSKIAYSLDDGINWTEKVSDIKKTAKGEYQVLYKAVPIDPTKYVESEVLGPINVTIGAVSPKIPDLETEEPLLKCSRTYTGEEQTLFTGQVKFKDENGNYSNGIVYYELTLTDSEPEADGGTSTIAEITATDAGISESDHKLQTYYLWARIEAGSNHSPVGWKKVATNTIEKADPPATWWGGFFPGGTLYRDGITGKRLVYNGTAQTLFSGEPVRKGTSAVKIKYGYKKTGSSEIVMESYTLGDLTATNAVDINGTQLEYSLYYSSAETQNYNKVDWTLVKIHEKASSYDKTPIVTTIDRATLSVSATLLPGRDYNGEASPILSNINTTSNSPSVMGNFSLTFEESRSWLNGGKTHQRFEEKISGKIPNNKKSLFEETRAGTYTVSVDWVPNATLKEIEKKQYVSDHRDFGTTTIRQIDADIDELNFTGLEKNSNMTITQDGTCVPYPNASFSLNWKGIEQDNGVSFHNNTDKAGVEVNQFSYCFVHYTEKDDKLIEGGVPAAKHFIETKSAAEINNAFKTGLEYKGQWTLYVRIDRHFNLKSGQVYKIDEFDIDGYVFKNEDFEGITFSESVVFDGVEHIVATGKLKPKINVQLGAVYYAIGDTAQVPELTEWKNSIAELAPRINVGEYRLFIKWDASVNAEAFSVGRSFGKFEIKKCTIDDIGTENLAFQNANFSDEWGAGETDGTFITYSKIYENVGYGLGDIGNPIATIINSNFKNIHSNEFGNLYFAVGDVNQATSEYAVVSSDDPNAKVYAALKIKDVNPNGNYYLWVRWDGTDNIEPGACIYRVYVDEDEDDDFSNGKAMVPQFRIVPKTDNDNVVLAHENFVSSYGQVEYQWKWDNAASSAVARSQPIFGATGVAIAVNINGELYEDAGVSYQYLVADESVEDVSAETGWKDSIGECMVSEVGNYNLWVLVKIQNTNVNLTKAIKVSTSAEIVKTSAFVRLKPVANGNLKANNGEELVLISAKEQMAPVVEYAVIKKGEELPDDYIWIQGVSNVKATEAGTYHVYYRGAENESFFTQTRPGTGYPYVVVYVDNEDSVYAPRPTAVAMKYTGTALKPFKPGAALIGSDPATQEKVNLLYSWDEGEVKTWHDFDTLLGITEVGTYLLYYKPDYQGQDKYSSLCVEIEKADIQIESKISSRQFIYRGADYQLLNSNDIDFAMIDDNGSVLNVGGQALKYSYCKDNTNLYGAMGKIYYGVSTSSTIAPKEWKDSFSAITARAVGKYYIWVKVDESGKNHSGIEPTCYNSDQPLEITQVTYKNEDGTFNFNAEGSSYDTIPTSYKGVNQALISSVALTFKVAKRDVNGNIIEGQYNDVNPADVGTIHYALSSNNDATDNDNEIWQRSYQILSKVDAGTYYLKIKIVGDCSLGTAIFCLQGEEIKITPADKNSIELSGVKPLTQMYTGNPQILASGDLTVKIKATKFNLADQVDVKYYYAKQGELVGDTSDWKTFDEAMVTNVGQYYLYVRLAFNTNNVEPNVIYMPLFSEVNYAEITKAAGNCIKITAPTFLTNLAYKGSEQNLIAPGAPAGIKMENGAEIEGQKGEAIYYISTSDKTNTSDKPINSINDVKGKDAGTYYIWVEFTAGAVHEAVSVQYVGSVTIAKANDQNINLVGLDFSTPGYDGTLHNIVSYASLTQLLVNGKETYILQKDVDYTKIEYAYSTSSDIMPDPNNQNIWFENPSDLKACDAGKYYVWVKVTGTDNVANYVKRYEEDHFEIFKVNLFPNDNWQGELNNVALRDDLVYIAQSQALASINGELSLQVNGVKQDLISLNDDLKIYWALGANNKDKPISGWVSNLSELQGVNSGDYHIWIWIQESKNINERKVYLGTVTIYKANIEFINPVANEGLIYNGAYQELIAKAPIAKFYTEYEGEGKIYYEAHEVVIEYTLNHLVWFTDIREITGRNADQYQMTYRVRESNNWAYKEGFINIRIAAADGSIVGVGLAEAPAAIANVYYNESEQDLITFGKLTDAAIKNGCKIVFFYKGDNQNQYEYYFDKEQQKYVWGANGPLPGRKNVSVGEPYQINYFVTGSGNFINQSVVKVLSVNINKRFVSWLVRPEAVYDFDYTDGFQPLIRPGELSVNNSDSIYVVYTTEAPGTPNRAWSPEVPTARTPNLRLIWYRVVIKDENSIFVGSDDNTDGTQIAVYIEHTILTIEDMPTAKSEGLEYTAEEQNLIDYYFLSTDSFKGYGEDAPYIEFKLKDSPYDVWTRNVSATTVGKYTVLYRLNYNKTIFKFMGENDGSETPMELEVEIKPVQFEENSIRAVFNEENKTLSYEVPDKQIFNEETKQWEFVPQYSNTLMAELKQNNSITYYYCKNDENSRDVWQIWDEHNTANMTMGTYEFKVMIERPTNKEVNFLDYAQTGDFDTYTYTEDRTIEIVMQDFSSPAYVHVWIDFTGSMTYEDAKQSGGYYQEAWIDGITGCMMITFPDIESAGNNTSIRIQTVNDSYYYMTTDGTLSEANKKEITLQSQDLKIKTKAFNQGLIGKFTTIYLYEIYNIKYDANGGNGEIAEGWKWHNIDYLLAENTFTKNGLSAGGWNTSRTGNGTDYSGSMYYPENATQTFYAKYFKKGENSFVIQWVIKNNSKTYKLERDTLKWFNASLPKNETRTVGVFVDEGDLITLPQIQTAEDGSLSTIFDGYISGWETETGNIKYQIGMKATGNMTFVAKLKFGDYVQCKFENGEGEEIHDSGLIADGAEAYMALSGMDADFIKSYKDGYDKWVQEYGTKPLDSSKTPDGILTYQFGTKSTPVEDEENTGNSPESVTASLEDYLPMLIVIAVGVVLAVIVLFGYFAYRNKMKSKNITE